MPLNIRSTRVRLAMFSLFCVAAMSPGDLEAAKPSAKVKAQARIHFKKGKAAFELGRFSEALLEYEKAYQLLPLAGFLFNIGQCHRNLGNYSSAIFSFRLFLRKKPDASNRAAVERLISELEEKAAAEQSPRESPPVDTPAGPTELSPKETPQYTPAEPTAKVPDFIQPPPPPPPPPKPYYKRWWFWVPLAAVAVGGGAVGTYFAVRSKEPDIPPAPFPVWEIPSN